MFSNTQFALGAVAVALLAPSIQAVPTPSQNKAPTKVNLERRDPIASVCTQNDIMHASDFILYNNLWGEGDATSGSQCTYLDYNNTNSISWQTAWSWEGASDVKSYANAVLNIPATQLSTITSLASTWSWT
jgi:xyloglucan-specific endo-beta-1,4-glucanase